MTNALPPRSLRGACTAPFGLLPGEGFVVGAATVADTLPQLRWLFGNETVATPAPGRPLAGYIPELLAAEDIARWQATGADADATTYPPLVRIGAPMLAEGARLAGPGYVIVGGDKLAYSPVPALPQNRAYFDEHSIAYLHGKNLRLRGDWHKGRLFVRTLWPEDFRLSSESRDRPLPAIAVAAIRERLREAPNGGAFSPFAAETLWQRPGLSQPAEGTPVLAFILNGAQGDDDEAHAGHFAIATGRIGRDGSIADWLVANFYTLDAESEKGIVAAPLPLDNYLADLNAGQSWYRPSHLLVAALNHPRAALRVQSALFRIYHHYYRHRFSYHHARANCTGISVDALRALGWALPRAGAESWVRAIVALPIAIASGGVARGKMACDYLSEDLTHLLPAVAFERVAVDLLHLATHGLPRVTSAFEKMLADDLDALLLIRVPQLPTHRPWGDSAVVSNAEYRSRLPAARDDYKIIPVAPRRFPPDLVDANAPRAAPTHSDYVLAAYAIATVAALTGLAHWL